VKMQVDASSIVAATTATFAPPQDCSNIDCVSPKADTKASVIPDELYLQSVAKESTISKNWRNMPRDLSCTPRNRLPRNATPERFWNCVIHSFTDHFFEKSPRMIKAPGELMSEVAEEEH
jgi:hypothetical protein